MIKKEIKKKNNVTRYRWQTHLSLLPVFTVDRKPYLPARTQPQGKIYIGPCFIKIA